MSSGDFNYVTLRNIVPAHADGSFIQNGYILTVGPDAKQAWVNSLALQSLVTSTLVVNSTVRFPAGIYDNLWYSTAYGSTSYLQSLTASTATVSSLQMHAGEFSTLMGSMLTASSVSVSSLWFSTAMGSSMTVSTLSASTLYFSTMGGSTLWTSTLAASTATLGMAAVGDLTAQTLAATTASVNLGYYSTLWGSTLSASTATVSTLGVSTLAVSTSAVSLETVSSLAVSTSLVGSLGIDAGQFSTLAGSVLIASSIGVSSMGFSTATGSTLSLLYASVSSIGAQAVAVSTLYGFTANVSSLGVNAGQFSTLLGSTLSVSTAAISTAGVSTLGVTTLSGLSLAASTLAMNAGQFSTLFGSTLLVSSMGVSSMGFSTALGSSLWVSSLFGSTIGFSTAVGSTLGTALLSVSTATVSTLGVSSLAVSSLTGLQLAWNGGSWYSTLQGSTLKVSSVEYSVMGGSTLTANTFMASTLALVSSGKLGVGLGAAQPTYNLQTGLYNSVNLSGNFLESWSIVSTDMTAFTATYNGTLTGPAGSPSAMSLQIGALALDAVATFTGTLVPGNVYQLSFMAKCSVGGGSFYLCNHMGADQIIAGTVSTALTTGYQAYTITFTAPSGRFGVSFVGGVGTVASWYGFQLQGFFTSITGGLGVGTTGPAYGLHVPLGSLQAYNYQQFEWINTQSGNTLGWYPASGAGLFRVATMGSTTAGYGLVNLRGTVGDLYNPMYVDLSVLTRGGLKVFGTVEGTAAGATKCDLVYAVNGAGGYDLYIYVRTASYIVFDIQVSGASGSNVLYDPAASAVVGVSAVTAPTSLTAMATSFVTGAGNVGIGRSNPEYAVDVAGSINVSGTVLVNGIPISLLSNPTGATGSAGKPGATGLSGGGTGPTGPPGGPVSVLSQRATGTQVLASATPTLVLWPTVDILQCTGLTGLEYAAGLFRNTTYVTIPILVEYSLFLDATGYGSSYIAVNGAANAFGVMYNDVNAFTNSYTVLVPAGASVGVYYTDNGTPTILSSSRVTLTLLTAGQRGPTGMSQMTTVATLSVVAAGQTVTGGANATPVVWGTIDVLQTQNITGLTYVLPTGLFVNNSPAPLPLLFEYSVQLAATSGGASFIGIILAGDPTVRPYGPALNDNNAFVGSYTVLVPAGASVGVYYMDNQTTQVSPTSQLMITLLFSAWGPTGPMGTVAQPSMMARVPAVTQAIPAVTTTVIRWGSMDLGQTSGTVGLSYDSGTGLFTNSTVLPLPLMVEYAVFLDTTGSGTSSIGVNGASTVYGTMYNDNNCFTNSYTVLLPSGATLGVYYYDNNNVTVQVTSRLMITLLTSGPQGPIGPTGQTGTSLWSASGAVVSYSAGNVGIGVGDPRQRLTIVQNGECTTNEYGVHSMAITAAQASGNMVLLMDADNASGACAVQSVKDSIGVQALVLQPRGGTLQTGTAAGTNTSALVLNTGYKLVVEQGQGVNNNGIWVSNSNYNSVQGMHLSMVNAGLGALSSYAVLQGTASGQGQPVSICLQPQGGNVGIGTNNPGFALHVVGNIYATGTITQASDARLKTHVEPIMGAMEYIRRLKGCWYERMDHEVGRRQMGFLAQEMAGVFPEAVRSTASAISADAGLSVDYGCLTAPLVEGLKETDLSVRELQRGLVIAHRKIRDLTDVAEEMEAEIQRLKERAGVLEAAMADHMQLRVEFEDLKAALRLAFHI